VIAVGRTRWVNKGELDSIQRDGFIIRRKGNALVIAGPNAKASIYGVVRFLDEYAGIRFYLPGELFTSMPAAVPLTIKGINLTVQPYLLEVDTAGSFSGKEAVWARLRGLDRRVTSNQHDMWNRFPPSEFAKKYPKIYPILKGKRYVPTSGRDQRWQPTFSEPTLVDVAVESAARFFHKNPEISYISFGIQDSHDFSEVDLQSDLVKKEGRVQGLSNLYWSFIDKVAQRLSKEFPDKKVAGMAYGDVRSVPTFKLQPNVVVWLVFKISDIAIDHQFDPGKNGNSAAAWAHAASALAIHDWAQGKGFLIPRIYSVYFKKTFQELERLGSPVRSMHPECYPNWGLDGPKLYIMSRLFQDPSLDVDALRAQFCTDMFGPAAKPMQNYFGGAEKLFLDMESVQERKLGRWTTQFLLNDKQKQMVLACRADLEEAKKLAATDQQKQRIDLFSKTFHLSEMLFDLANTATPTAQQGEAIRQYVATTIAPDPMTLYGQLGVKDYVAHEVDGAIRQLSMMKRKK
jgi:hypothetical protein